MAINFDKAFGIHDNALLLFERRNQLLAENIGNADTPDYQARDIDFNKVLQGEQSEQLKLQTTREGHIAMPMDESSLFIEYRVPQQGSADNNTVDVQQEKAAYAENSVRYQTTLDILSRRISGLKNAFKGE
jgi:flagellar basal-body rod protein FlgB